MTRRISHEQFKEEIHRLVGNDYTVISTYTRSKDKITMNHTSCGTTWEITPNNFKKGKRCPTCNNQVKNTKKFKEEVNELHKGNIEVISDYVDCDTKVTLRCNKHKEPYNSTPTNVLRGRTQCPMCKAENISKAQRKTEEVFKEELASRHKGNLTSLEAYVNTHTKLEFLCSKCNKTFKAEPNSVLRISGCPNCIEYKGETFIESYLNSLGLEFEIQKTFLGCKHKRNLPFDFYIKSENLLIEYDGKQHYEPIEFFGGKESFEKQLLRDSIKDKYAIDNNIQLLRIPYSITGEAIGEEINKHLGFGSPSLEKGSNAESLKTNIKVMI